MPKSGFGDEQPALELGSSTMGSDALGELVVVRSIAESAELPRVEDVRENFEEFDLEGDLDLTSIDDEDRGDTSFAGKFAPRGEGDWLRDLERLCFIAATRKVEAAAVIDRYLNRHPRGAASNWLTERRGQYLEEAHQFLRDSTALSRALREPLAGRCWLHRSEELQREAGAEHASPPERAQTSESARQYLSKFARNPNGRGAAANEIRPGEFLGVLGAMVRAAGITQTADRAGLERKSVQRILDDDANPQWNSLLAVLDALGLRMTLTAQTEPAPLPASPVTRGSP
jgi:probable addiction module antidote protein